MKKVYKEVQFITNDLEYVNDQTTYNSTNLNVEIKGLLNYEKFKILHEVEEPETIKEFRQLKQLSKEQLVKWLNENYK